ncbi:ABC transporter ATP-binding protein [Rhodopseudomonas palustris]|uniref:ABC transporter ATP-binding protein n=1 Tax=Rhodopseudomonas palustris (strain ATCC BAA-98 / CGA009) TaxID=258594 RepID=Q6NB41_RHOPA|nr:ABC transporter ATP-binding protein [Rhodopseudomonas palustris]OPF91881.1 ABC transporter ATP-binding protein [Rhodopseudomonas palustris]PPQ44704.1 ABC transporter ATP-binding protein [Rhodopseudomonas palustris]QQM02482.1 High-affinity branched-chain amino acid transport ATP-binding protein LivF [Rhodopseudomonas palustris]RJF60698.1 ABC transporter ATP-binding protein [Rhodopseudomonas palustris]WAB78671.1 ABC transporter ATP-binding protein [Rhodopseudomonas palustris]
MPAARLEVERLSAGYGSVSILSEIGFAVPAGGRLTVLGRNGVGKTTLLATLMGLTTHKGGTVRIGEREVTGLKTYARAAAGLGYVPQTRDVFRSLTVEENLFTGLKGRPRSELEFVYAMFPRLAERRNHGGMQLSGGEQQMLSLARTLLGKPSVLLLDEPLEGLAPVICDQLMATIIKLAESGEMTVVLVEQQIERALDFADDVLVVERGRIVWRGQAAEFRADRELADRLLGVGIG